MSDRMPTTAEVRERFVDGFPMDTWVVSRDECGRDFDAWLAALIAEKQAEALEQAAKAGAGYRVNPHTPRDYQEGCAHADIYWRLALERAAQRLREQAANQQNRSE